MHIFIAKVLLKESFFGKSLNRFVQNAKNILLDKLGMIW